MIYAVGIDLCERGRVDKILAKFGDKFYKRILTKAECTDLYKHKEKSYFIARRIAAKEAVVKALTTGIAQGVTWHSVEIGHDDNGMPRVKLFDKAAELAVKNNLYIHISITDEKNMAAAVAIAEKN